MTARLFGAWPGWPRAGLAFGLGAIIAAGQAPLDQWMLALAGLAAALMLTAQARSAPAAAWVGLFLGAGHFTLALSWIVEPFLIEPEVYAWMIPFVLVLMPFGLGLFWALAAGLAHRWGATYATRVLLFVVALTAAELTRGYVFTGFPWAMIGHIFIDTPIAQLATFAGAGGLTLFALLVTGLPVALGGRWIAVPILAIFIATVWGDNLPSPSYPADLTIVRLVQPNAEQHLKWDPDRAQSHMQRLLDLSRAPGTGARPDLVVWPETSVPYLLNNNDDLLRAIGDAGQGAPVAFGIQRVDGNRGYNTLAVVDSAGRITHTYDKHHLVPFGEYIPFGDIAYDLFGITAFAAQQGAGYSAGAGAAVLDLGPKLGRILPLICYEAVFPQDLRAANRSAAGRANWILHITNDAWFGTLTGPWQHLAQARLRAIEQALPVLRAANTGVSAVIDARGRVVAQIPLGRAAFVDAAVPMALPPTLYARHGDLPLVLLLLGLAFALVALRRRHLA